MSGHSKWASIKHKKAANDSKNTKVYQEYQSLARQEAKNVLFGGRLAQYTYADMDDTVAAALDLFRKEVL